MSSSVLGYFVVDPAAAVAVAGTPIVVVVQCVQIAAVGMAGWGSARKAALFAEEL